MDAGGLNLLTIEVIAVAVLGALLLWVVLKTRSKGKQSSPERTERGTRELYAEEERRHQDGTDDS